MDQFCGQRFWDWNLTWYTNDLHPPDFTPCFQATVLVWIPAVFLWILAPIDIRSKWSAQPKLIPRNALNMTKSALNFVLLLVHMSVLFYNFSLNQRGVTAYPVQYITPIIRVLTFSLALFHLRFGNRKGVRSSGIQFYFWFTLCACDLFGFRSQIINSSNPQVDTDTFEFGTTMISYPLVIAMLLLNCWADVSSEYKEPKEIQSCPEESSSILSQLTFDWFFPMAWKGYRKPLEHHDLWDINDGEKSRTQTPRFDKHWNRLKSAKKTYVSILPVLFNSLGTTFIAGAVFKVFQDLATFASPEILKLMIAFVSGDEELWKGYLYVALMSIAAMSQTLLMAQYFHRMLLTGMRIRTVLVSAIFRKSLVLSNSARSESTVGEIVNLMAVDASRLQDMMPHICLLWSAPFQIILALYLLWQTLGPSILAGVVLMVLMIPMNSYIATQMKKLQVIQMKKKDQRVKLMNEILSGIKVLKLYAWERSFQEQILKIREEELRVIRRSAYLYSGIALVWTCTPFLVSLVTFGTYVLIDESNILDAGKAFVSLSLFNILRRPLTMFPMVITSAIQASVSLKRLNKFMNAEEIDFNKVTHDPSVDDQVVIEDGTFSWSSSASLGDAETVLRNINIRVPQGSLCAIVGEVGSGKSSLLAAILGELDKKSGIVNTKGSIAYVSQQAWIQNATLKDNVLFSLPFDWPRYDKVIDSCALKPDLEILPGGDQTEIGEKGINLSGGQKQRVALARAAYNNADVYLLDDPLSAVDSHVGKHIFEHVIGPKGMLKNKTRVLVTHGITHLPEVDFIIVLNKGEIVEQGTYKELLSKKGDFSEFIIRHLEQMDEVANGELLIIKDIEQVVGSEKVSKIMTRQTSKLSEADSATSDGPGQSGLFHRSVSKDRPEETPIRQLNATEKTNGVAKNRDGEKIIEVEKSATGSTKGKTYLYYAKSIGYILSIVCLLLYGSYETFGALSNVWLSEWSNVVPVNGTQDIEQRNFYLMVFGLLGSVQVIAFLIGGITMAYGTIRAASTLHRDMLARILRAPSSFFDTTPTGRIVNRFAKDVDTCDSALPDGLRDFITVFQKVISTFVIISLASPYFIMVVIPTVVLYIALQRFYMASARQLRRMESVSRSPIYSHFSETINGCTTIRAFGAQERFILQSEAHVDYNQRAYYGTIVSNRWLGIRLEWIGNILILFVSLFAVLGRDTISPGIVGLSLTYALQVTMVLNFSVRMMSGVETNMVAVERLKEYSMVQQEAPAEIPAQKPPQSWPESGEISFEGYQTRYREGLDLVLRKVTVHVEPAEKVGIVGRTGSGKSTLALGLFRLLEPVGGTIKIDGRDICKIGLHDLRSRLTIIPQDPVLFSGTLRINLDPFSQYADETLWRALGLAHLKAFVKGLDSGLEYDISEGGQNLSVGQRQLICLARAVLRKSKILVLDEATAQVDLDTDELIQETIRSEFKDSTVLTIAHRINTIMDYTRVMVLDKGEVREFDTPQALLKEKSSLFYKMVQDAGLVQ